MEFWYTKHQVARGALADAESQDRLLLFKNVSALRLTYEIRLLNFRASQSNKKLVVQVPKHCKIHASLREFAKELPKAIRVEKV